MSTTDAILYGEIKRLRTECERLRNCYQAEYKDANYWNHEYCKMMIQCATVKKERDSARAEVSMVLEERNRAITERDDLADRFKNVKEQRDEALAAGNAARQERDKALADVELWRESSQLKGNTLADTLRDLQFARGQVVQEQAKVANLTKIRARQASDELAAAEVRIADIGWRKNKLVAAIEAKGYVVRWQPDGTPEVLTKEQAAERDKPKPGRTFPTYSYALRYLVDSSYNPFSFLPTDTLEKPAAPQPSPTGQPYYDRAIKAVYGYVVTPATWAGVTKGVIARLDDALDAEIRKDDPDWVNCGNPLCRSRTYCMIWQQRPWKRA